jgi:hypothetical protein
MAVKITAPYVNDKLEEHIIKHNDVYWPMLKKHDELLVGPKGDDGICFDVKEIMKGFKTIEKLGYAVIVMILLDFVTRVMSIGK